MFVTSRSSLPLRFIRGHPCQSVARDAKQQCLFCHGPEQFFSPQMNTDSHGSKTLCNRPQIMFVTSRGSPPLRFIRGHPCQSVARDSPPPWLEIHPVRGRRFGLMTLFQSSHSCTASTGQPACSSTCSVVEPRSASSSPLRPAVVMAMRSACSCCARCRIVLTTEPSAVCQ